MAWVWWAIQIVAAVLVVALQPKPKKPEAMKANVPQIDEGRPVRWDFGDVIHEDAQVLAFIQDGTTPIKSKGKK